MRSWEEVMTSRIRFWVVVWCGVGLLQGCPSSGDGEYQSCSPQCQERVCGNDGCGGSCGECDALATCSNEGKCIADADTSNAPEDVVAQFEILVPDGSPAKICQSLYLQFQAALEEGPSCDHVLECSVTVPAGDPCHCTLYTSDVAVSAHLAALEAEYTAQGCAAGEYCDACPWIEVPVCNHGVCTPSQPPCPEVEGQYAQALLQAKQCTEDEQCNGNVAGSLDCHCEVPVNSAAWTGYFDLAQELWNTSDCGPPLDCSCAALYEVGCLDGVCGTLEDKPTQSKVCDVPEDCIPISGCACGCWSVPPDDEEADACPCAAPAACDCDAGACTPST